MLKKLFHLPVFFSWFFIVFVLCFNFSYAASQSTFSDCLLNSGQEFGQIETCQPLFIQNSVNRDRFVSLGKILDKNQKNQQSLKVYQKALQIFTNDKYFNKKYLIARSNLEERQWLDKKKKQSNTKKMQPSSSSVEFKLNKLRCIRLTGDIALKSCHQAIKLNNKDAELFISKGNIYALKKQNKRAVTAYKKALKLNPEDRDTSNKLKKILQSR